MSKSSGKKPVWKTVLVSVLVFLCIALGLPSGLLGNRYISAAMADRADALASLARYGEDLGMLSAANPQAPNGDYVRAIRSNPWSYHQVRFDMELPPVEERKQGVIYFAPDPSGRTQERLDYLNIIVGSSYPDFSFMITIDKAVAEPEATAYLCDDTRFKGTDIHDIEKQQWQMMRSWLYAKIFMFQCSGDLSSGTNESSPGKDSYLSYAANFDLDRYYQLSIAFLAEPPLPEAVQQMTAWFYPHQKGHTMTLIDNLNVIVAESPELLAGSGLSAPLALADIINNQDVVWDIIHQLDAGQIERFRSY